MSTRGDALFAEKKLSTLLLEREGEMEARLRLGKSKRPDGMGDLEWVDRVESESVLSVPALKEELRTVSRKETGGAAPGDVIGSALFGGGTKSDEFTVEVPFSGTFELFDYAPTTGPSTSAPMAMVEEDKLVLSYNADGGEEAAEAAAAKDLKLINKYLKSMKREVGDYNGSVRERCARERERLGGPPGKDEVSVSFGTETVIGDGEEKPLEEAAPKQAGHPGLESGVVCFSPFVEWKEEEEAPAESVEVREEPEPSIKRQIKTGLQTRHIVDLDLFSYSDIARELDRSLGAQAVQVLNRQVKGFVADALDRVGMTIYDLHVEGTGDGAILAFDDAETAVRFAENVHIVADEYNRTKDLETARRHFRVGVGTGEVIVEAEYAPDGELRGYSMAGTPIAKSVRLESCAKTGEVMICAKTWETLSPETRSLYGPAETVKGKRQEKFIAHRRRISDPAP